MNDISSNTKFRATWYFIDFKLMAIPLVFILLRIWSLIISIVYDYAHVNERNIPNWIEYILVCLSVSLSSNVVIARHVNGVLIIDYSLVWVNVVYIVHLFSTNIEIVNS